MKINLSLDKNRLQEFFLQHAEKIVVALVGLCSILIVYRAMNSDSFKKTPGDMTSSAGSAKKHIEDQQPKQEVKAPDYETWAKRSRERIKVKPYELAQRLNPPIIPQRALRPRVVPLVAEKLRGSAGRGTFDIAVSQGSRGRRWAVITALVPVAMQTEAFDRAFREAVFHDSQKDVVVYEAFQVQRAEIGSSGAAGELEWNKEFFSGAEFKEAQKAWKKSDREVVDKKFIHASLTAPLGPLVGLEWGAEAAHPPQVPVMEKEEGKKTAAGKSREDEQEDEVDTSDIFGKGRKKSARQPKKTEPSSGDSEKGPEYYLLRFFDFHVQPGKSYRYRVRLAMRNPNEGVDPRHLVVAQAANEQFIVSDWSEPSPVVTIPSDVQIIVRKTGPATRPLVSPTAEVAVRKWDNPRGRMFQVVEQVVRGQMIDFPDRALKASAGKGAKSERLTVNFVTHALTLDMVGGERLPGPLRLTTPGELLVMEADGNLVIRNELEDLAQVEDEAESEAAPEKDKPGPGEKPKPSGGGADLLTGQD